MIKEKILIVIVLIPLLGGLVSCNQQNKEKKRPPNIIYILADDLGYGELGCYGQDKIETPNIDKLADSGIKFTQHYSGSAVCAPSRYMLLTGQHPGHAAVRANHEWGSRGDVWSYEAMIQDSTLEGQFPMPDTTVTIGHLLQKGGYVTGMVGKWGLGAPQTHSIPNKMGFDFFYGYNCQRIAHTYYPVHLYKNENRVYLNNDTVKPHINSIEDGADPFDIKSYDKFSLNEYAPDLMHKEALNFIEENKEKPFFLYYASPIPHLPLQAPKKWVDYYVNKFGDEKPMEKASYYPQRYPRAAYAAMISCLDEQVGEIITKLKELGIYENTLIVFTSDNGPTYIEADVEWFQSAGNLNNEKKRLKGRLYEGGVRVPLIASWPGKIKKGTETDHISAFWDVMPTFCNLAAIPSTDHTDGISFLPELLDKEQEQHKHLYWEFAGYGGQQAVRMGKWKGIRKDILKGNTEIELYNLEDDIKEENNLAGKFPEIVKQIEDIMQKEHTQPDIERFKMEAIGDVLEK
ncbi:MAG: arylsulfatase [Bacteroidota bacterium]